MSTQNNTDLYEKVAELIDYWEGTLHARLIERAMDTGDLEALKYHVNEAEKEMRIQEDVMHDAKFDVHDKGDWINLDGVPF